MNAKPPKEMLRVDVHLQAQPLCGLRADAQPMPQIGLQIVLAGGHCQQAETIASAHHGKGGFRRPKERNGLIRRCGDGQGPLRSLLQILCLVRRR